MYDGEGVRTDSGQHGRLVELIINAMRWFIVLSSFLNAIAVWRYCVKTKTKYLRGFAIIAGVVPLEWIVFYLARALDVSHTALNNASLFITSQTLMFLLTFMIYVSLTDG